VAFLFICSLFSVERLAYTSSPGHLLQVVKGLASGETIIENALGQGKGAALKVSPLFKAKMPLLFWRDTPQPPAEEGAWG